MSSSHSAADLDAVLLDLQNEFVAVLPQRVQELRASIELAETNSTARVTVRRIGHRLGGTAATVGLQSIGDAGRAIERLARARGEVWDRETIDTLSAAVDALDAWTARALTPGGARDPSLSDDPRIRRLAAVSAPPDPGERGGER